MPIKGVTHVSVLTAIVLFIVTIMLRWRRIMMTAEIESDYVITCLR